jgi:hypothetical protein
MEVECDCHERMDNLWDWVKSLQDRVEELEKWKEAQEDAKANTVAVSTE